MLYRCADSPDASGTDLSAFTDGAQISPWAEDAMSWAVDNGILTGRPGQALAPQDGATRAEVSVMLMRYLEL